MQIFRTKLLVLAANQSTVVKIWVAFVWYQIRSKFNIKKWGEMTLNLKFHNYRFDFTIGEYFDLIALEDTFVNQDYKISLANNRPVIFDLGAHIGTEAIYFKILYPHAQLYCYEPSPRNLHLLRVNTQQFSDIQILPFAISHNSGKINLFLHPKSSLSSSLTLRSQKYHPIIVDAVTLGSQLKKYRLRQIDLLKFDVEGEEYRIFKYFKNKKLVKNMIGEFHAEITNRTVEEFIALFPNFKGRYYNLYATRSIVVLSQC